MIEQISKLTPQQCNFIFKMTAFPLVIICGAIVAIVFIINIPKE